MRSNRTWRSGTAARGRPFNLLLEAWETSMTYLRHTVRGAAAALVLLSSATGLTGVAMAQGNAVHAEIDPLNQVPEARARIVEEGEGDRVLGGTEAEKDAWPFQVALLASAWLDNDPRSQFDAQFCGGTLISPEWVLTAAHCITDGGGNRYPAESMTALIGATSLDEGRRVAVVQAIPHEDYSPVTLDNDIALLRLAEAVDAPTVTLADAAIPTESGAATVIGWGLTEHGTAPVSLLQAEIGLYPNSACNDGIKTYIKQGLQMTLLREVGFVRLDTAVLEEAMAVLEGGIGDPLTEVMLCAGTPSGQMSSCYGDSGGPLLVSGENGPVQVGVVSWGAGPWDAENQCGHENAYAVYARVSSFTDWIAEKTTRRRLPRN